MTAKTVILSLLVASCSFATCATSASAVSATETPGVGWEAYSQSFPTNMHAGAATDEVQEITVLPAQGETAVRFQIEGHHRAGTVLASEPLAKEDGVLEATAANVQATLEGDYGAHNVLVEEQTGPGVGEKRYSATLVGERADQALPNRGGYAISVTAEVGSASAHVATQGRPDGTIQVAVFDTGAKPSEGSIMVTDALPPGLTAIKAGGMRAGAVYSSEEEDEDFGGASWLCTGNGSGNDGILGATVLTCTSDPLFLPELPQSITPVKPTFPGMVGVAVKVQEDVKEGTKAGVEGNRVTVAGGGAASVASVSDPLTVSSAEPEFGFPGWDMWIANADGSTDTQAGSHPYEVTFVNGFNHLANGNLAGGEARDLEAISPPGFFGDPGSVPRCTRTQLDQGVCSAQTQLGVDTVWLPGATTTAPLPTPVYNMVPPPGVADEFAFSVAGIDVAFDAGVRSGHGYPIVEHIDNLATVHEDLNALTLWGVPAATGHNGDRCQTEEVAENNLPDVECGRPPGVLPKAFLTLPTSCGAPLAFVLKGLSTWTNENAKAEATVLTHNETGSPVGLTGCEKLSVAPSFTAVPDTAFADTPAGLTAEVKVPQENLTNPTGLVAATLQNTTVTLPEGVVINPGQAAGLAACQPAEANVEGEGPQSCPSASKVGTVSIQTPLLEDELESEFTGNVYVLQSDPPNLQLLVTASADGVNLKLVGDVHLNEATGRLTTTFTGTPELPFTDFKLTFSGGAQAALATPAQCGTFSTSSDFTPWTSPFTADILGSDSFQITAGPGGGACPSSPLPFSPTLTAGATTDQAGGFTDFSLLLQRGDGQQRIDGLQFRAPEGLTGELSKIPLCTNAQAEANECPEASKIGHAVVESGPGPYPLVVPEPGQPPAPIYLTESYDGAPFGLSIVTPLHVGPFTLPTQRVRARIEIDPITTQLTVTTDPLPQMVAGVPTDLREIDSVIERPEFMINPTNCNPQEFSGTAYGTPPPGQGGAGASATISSHFQVGSCQSLKFEPKFSVSASGKTSKAYGASLTSKVTYPSVPQGTDADIALVKVELPKQLPSRLTTLQKACTNAQFQANPAGCPQASLIGHAVVHTPLLPVPLEGPAIFVSHGGEAFPSLTLVLQGDGVTVDLVGSTFIKNGVTSTTFKTLPDQPFSSFELTLPEGPYSALAANGNLCTTKLAMPNEFAAQNGTVIRRSTPINVTGCKPTISVLDHLVKSRTATITVQVPAAGKLTATAKGLSTATAKCTKPGELTVQLTLSRAQQAFMSHHHARKIATVIHISFTPKKGSRLSTSVSVLIG